MFSFGEPNNNNFYGPTPTSSFAPTPQHYISPVQPSTGSLENKYGSSSISNVSSPSPTLYVPNLPIQNEHYTTSFANVQNNMGNYQPMECFTNYSTYNNGYTNSQFSFSPNNPITSEHNYPNISSYSFCNQPYMTSGSHSGNINSPVFRRNGPSYQCCTMPHPISFSPLNPTPPSFSQINQNQPLFHQSTRPSFGYNIAPPASNTLVLQNQPKTSSWYPTDPFYQRVKSTSTQTLQSSPPPPSNPTWDSTTTASSPANPKTGLSQQKRRRTIPAFTSSTTSGNQVGALITDSNPNPVTSNEMIVSLPGGVPLFSLPLKKSASSSTTEVKRQRKPRSQKVPATAPSNSQRGPVQLVHPPAPACIPCPVASDVQFESTEQTASKGCNNQDPNSDDIQIIFQRNSSSSALPKNSAEANITNPNYLGAVKQTLLKPAKDTTSHITPSSNNEHGNGSNNNANVTDNTQQQANQTNQQIQSVIAHPLQKEKRLMTEPMVQSAIPLTSVQEIYFQFPSETKKNDNQVNERIQTALNRRTVENSHSNPMSQSPKSDNLNLAQGDYRHINHVPETSCNQFNELNLNENASSAHQSENTLHLANVVFEKEVETESSQPACIDMPDIFSMFEDISPASAIEDDCPLVHEEIANPAQNIEAARANNTELSTAEECTTTHLVKPTDIPLIEKYFPTTLSDDSDDSDFESVKDEDRCTSPLLNPIIGQSFKESVAATRNEASVRTSPTERAYQDVSLAQISTHTEDKGDNIIMQNGAPISEELIIEEEFEEGEIINEESPYEDISPKAPQILSEADGVAHENDSCYTNDPEFLATTTNKIVDVIYDASIHKSVPDKKDMNFFPDHDAMVRTETINNECRDIIPWTQPVNPLSDSSINPSKNTGCFENDLESTFSNDSDYNYEDFEFEENGDSRENHYTTENRNPYALFTQQSADDRCSRKTFVSPHNAADHASDFQNGLLSHSQWLGNERVEKSWGNVNHHYTQISTGQQSFEFSSPEIMPKYSNTPVKNPVYNPNHYNQYDDPTDTVINLTVCASTQKPVNDFSLNSNQNYAVGQYQDEPLDLSCHRPLNSLLPKIVTESQNHFDPKKVCEENEPYGPLKITQPKTRIPTSTKILKKRILEKFWDNKTPDFAENTFHAPPVMNKRQNSIMPPENPSCNQLSNPGPSVKLGDKQQNIEIVGQKLMLNTLPSSKSTAEKITESSPTKPSVAVENDDDNTLSRKVKRIAHSSSISRPKLLNLGHLKDFETRGVKYGGTNLQRYRCQTPIFRSRVNATIKNLIKFTRRSHLQGRKTPINKTKSKLNADLNKVFVLGGNPPKRKFPPRTFGSLKEVQLEIPRPMESQTRFEIQPKKSESSKKEESAVGQSTKNGTANKAENSVVRPTRNCTWTAKKAETPVRQPNGNGGAKDYRISQFEKSRFERYIKHVSVENRVKPGMSQATKFVPSKAPFRPPTSINLSDSSESENEDHTKTDLPNKPIEFPIPTRPSFSQNDMKKVEGGQNDTMERNPWPKPVSKSKGETRDAHEPLMWETGPDFKYEDEDMDILNIHAEYDNDYSKIIKSQKKSNEFPLI